MRKRARPKKSDREFGDEGEIVAGDSQEVSQNLGEMFGALLTKSEQK